MSKRKKQLSIGLLRLELQQKKPTQLLQRVLWRRRYICMDFSKKSYNSKNSLSFWRAVNGFYVIWVAVITILLYFLVGVRVFRLAKTRIESYSLADTFRAIFLCFIRFMYGVLSAHRFLQLLLIAYLVPIFFHSYFVAHLNDLRVQTWLRHW